MAHIKCTGVVKGSRSQVYDYLTDPHSLPGLLNDHIEVQVENADVAIQAGSELTFMMTRYGISQPVRFYLEKVVPGISLTYRQSEGLFVDWVHTLKFEDHGDGATLVTDMVDYHLPFGLVGHIADDFYLRRDLRNILNTRLRKAADYFNQLSSES